MVGRGARAARPAFETKDFKKARRAGGREHGAPRVCGGNAGQNALMYKPYFAQVDPK